MAERGYPTEDVDQITTDLSVDHADTLGRFRTAQDISGRAADGSASTEDLRQAMVHYRALFQDLLGESAAYTENQAAYGAADAPFGTTEAEAAAVAQEHDYAETRPAAGPDYAEAQEMAREPDGTQTTDVTEPDPLPARPVGRHHAEVGPEDNGGYAEPAALDDEAEPAAASRLPWRK
jgi:hypothetical protein